MRSRLSYLVLRLQHRKTANVSIAISTTNIIEDENRTQYMNDDSPALRKDLVSSSYALACHNLNVLRHRENN